MFNRILAGLCTIVMFFVNSIGNLFYGDDSHAPDWASSLILMEVHLETATPEGTFQSGVRVLDHCAELGVNGIWLTPIYEKGVGGNGYGNIGPHTVEPALTGTADCEAGWNVVKWYVDEAHRRDIHILLDIVTWGVVTASPLFAEHPDWFSGKAWGNEAFNWGSKEFKEWFITQAVDIIAKTGADGFRADCEPHYAGEAVFKEIRRRLANRGREILIIAEDGARHGEAYDFEQDGVLLHKNWSREQQYTAASPKRWYIDEMNIVDSVRKGRGIGSSGLQGSLFGGGRQRLYTYCVSNHDFQYSAVNGNRLVLGYQAIFAPFIPLWYFGEEFNFQDRGAVFYYQPVDWSLLEEPGNRAFFEDVKQYIAIRRAYPEIFEYFPDNHRNANICKVEAENQPLQVYARYRGNRGVIVVGSNNPDCDSFRVTIPLREMRLGGYAEFTLTDLMTGELVASGSKTDVMSFAAQVAYTHIGVYLIEGRA